MSLVYVLDTHALIWHIQASNSLSDQARTILAQIDAGEATAMISAITLVEMVYLAEKKRIPREPVTSLIEGFQLSSDNYRLAPIDLGVIHALEKVPRKAVPDMPDRIIVATAVSLGTPVLSRDAAIQDFEGVESIW